MGHKISAYTLRLGINQPWKSNYFPPKNKKRQVSWLRQDKLIRDYLFARFPEIIQIKIERTETELVVFVRSPEASSISGESNDDLDAVLNKITQIVNDQKIITKLYLETEKNVYSSAQAIANDLARQLENRVSSRLALRSLQGVKNFTVRIKGVLDKIEIAQDKKTSWGKMPFGTLSKLIKDGFAEANTDRGQVGITVSLYKEKSKKIKYVNFNTQKN